MRQATDLRSVTTREALLDCAERLFLERGHAATSLRDITREAHANLAAVNYHFGGKEALIQAVLKRRLASLNSERLAVLDGLESQAGDQALKPSQIVDAFFGTLLRQAASPKNAGGRFLTLLERTMTDPANFVHTVFADEYAGVLERFKRALFRALPDVPREEILWRFHFMLGATSFAIAGSNTLRLVMGWEDPGQDAAPAASEPSTAAEAERLLERLMSFLLGGLRAPLPQQATA